MLFPEPESSGGRNRILPPDFGGQGDLIDARGELLAGEIDGALRGATRFMHDAAGDGAKLAAVGVHVEAEKLVLAGDVPSGT